MSDDLPVGWRLSWTNSMLLNIIALTGWQHLVDNAWSRA